MPMTPYVKAVMVTAIGAAAVAALALAAIPIGGQTSSAARGTRLRDGKPDLNGVWQALNEANYDLQAHMARPAMALLRVPSCWARAGQVSWAFGVRGFGGTSMASQKQRTAARRNVKKAAAAAKRKRTVAHLPAKTRTALGKEGAKAARRKK